MQSVTDFGDEDTIKQAVFLSKLLLTQESLEELYGNIDDDIIIEVAKERNLILPEELREEEDDFDSENIKQGMCSAIELADRAIHSFVQTQRHFNNAGNLGLADLFGGKFFFSLMKHASVEDAERAISLAQFDLSLMNDSLVQLNIGRAQKRIGRAIRQVEKVRNELVKAYRKL